MKLIVQPDAGVGPVVQTIRRARATIDVSIFRHDRDEIEKALGAAVQRGVRVRALIAHTHGGSDQRLRELEERLLAAGVTVARTGDDLVRYHGKFMVVDSTLYLLGFNFTKQDIEKSRSFAIATRDRRTVQEALSLFEADSTRKEYKPSRSNLVVSPDTSREMLARFLRGSRRQLAIYDIKIQDPAMIKILEERSKKGVEIRVIGSMKGSSDSIAVRPLKNVRLHVRAIIRDGTRAFVGSMSLRKAELDLRREVGLLVSNPGVTRSLLRVFDSDWDESAKPKDKIKDKENEKDKDKKAGGRARGRKLPVLKKPA